MSLLKFILMGLGLFVSLAMAQAERTCPSPVADGDICRGLNFDLQKNLYFDQYIREAKGNNPAAALEALHSLEELTQLGFQCGIITSCDQMQMTRTNALGSGWSESIQSDAFPLMQDGATSCSFSSEIHIDNGNTHIRGMLNRRSGRLSYHLPGVACAPADLEVNRRLTVAESGMLFVDYSEHVDAFPGQWLMLRRKRTPQISLQANGNIRVVTANDHFFEVDATLGRVVDSDMVNADMFDPAQCRSNLRNNGTRTFTDIHLKSEVRREVGARYTDFGSERTEREINAYNDGLERQPL